MAIATVQPNLSVRPQRVYESYDLAINQGETFSLVVRWETLPLVYKSISGITKGGPATITCAAHGAPDGWLAAVVSAGGMRQINAKHFPPWSSEMHPVTSTGTDSLAFNDVNASSYTAYTSGGSLVYYTPVDMAMGYSARMQVRATVDAEDPPLLSLQSGVDAPLSGITIDNTAKTITVLINATDTAAIDWLTAVYDLELADGSAVITRLLSGNVAVSDEVTR